MPELTAVLAALREEERAAVAKGRDSLGDIRAEIARVEKQLENRPSLADRRAAANPTFAGPTERATRQLAALREEKAKNPDRAAEIDAEIARIEAVLKPAAPTGGAEATMATPVSEQRRGPGRPPKNPQLQPGV